MSKANALRLQIRRGTTLLENERPEEGEPFWDPELRRLGFWNFTFNRLDWFRIPTPADGESYVPRHELDVENHRIRWMQFNGVWGDWISSQDNTRVIHDEAGDSYQLEVTDVNQVVKMLHNTPNTVTIPLNATIAIPIGAEIEIIQAGGGQTTLIPASGVTIRSFGGRLKLAGQWASCKVLKIATNEWVAKDNLVA